EKQPGLFAATSPATSALVAHCSGRCLRCCASRWHRGLLPPVTRLGLKATCVITPLYPPRFLTEKPKLTSAASRSSWKRDDAQAQGSYSKCRLCRPRSLSLVHKCGDWGADSDADDSRQRHRGREQRPLLRDHPDRPRRIASDCDGLQHARPQ